MLGGLEAPAPFEALVLTALGDHLRRDVRDEASDERGKADEPDANLADEVPGGLFHSENHSAQLSERGTRMTDRAPLHAKIGEMRLATIVPPEMSAPLAAQIVDGLAVAFPSPWTVAALLAQDPEDWPPPGRAAWPVSDVQLLAPVPVPGAIFGVGRNYAAHARELGNEPDAAPTVFAKLARSSAPPAGPVRLPAAAEFVDYEGELAVVIGRGGRIAGYAVANDVSARDLQFAGDSGQWTRGKGADTFCPWGPWITTADELPDAIDLRLRTYVNGELRQDAWTSQMLFSPEQVIAHIQEVSRLEPGDLLLMGTPEGVGYGRDPKVALASGDVVRVELDLLGAIEHAIR